MKKQHFTTKTLHTPFVKKDPHGALHMPVYDSVAFEFDSAEDIEKAFRGQLAAHSYSRSSNPTVEHYEQQIRELTGALSVTALSSGMAAITNLLLTLIQSGDSVVTSKHLFGNTLSLLTKTLSPFGLVTKLADLTDAEDVERVIDKSTKLIFFETVTNPQLEIADIELLKSIAQKHNILLVADTTLTPPYLFDAKEFGVDIEIISSTKLFSGGATSLGGLIVDYGSYNWVNNPRLKELAEQFGPHAFTYKLKREVFRNLGSCLSPHNAYLQSLGLETAVLRAEKSVQNSTGLAKYLQDHSKVKRVNYPGLENNKFYSLAIKQFNGKPGSVITMDLDSQEACFRFLNNLKLIKRSTNLNDNKSLAIHPYSTIFCDYSHEDKMAMGVPDTMIRISLGIEELGDLIGDVEEALGG